MAKITNMKIFIVLTALLIAVAPQKCAKDEEESGITNLFDDRGYTVEDIRMRKAFTDWMEFCREADSIVLDARIQISEASDCYDDPHTINRGKLKSAIIRSESRLGKLSDHMLQQKNFTQARFQTDESILQEVENFKKDFRQKQEELNKSLFELKKLY